MNTVLKQTPSQTVGPYFAYGLTPNQYAYSHKSIVDNDMFKDEAVQGEKILIKGRVLDGNGDAINDAMIELTQETPRLAFGRMGTGTEKDNAFLFSTIKPSGSKNDAPHLNVVVMMRGLLSHVFTRIYFSDEIDANTTDKLLNLVSEERKQTLIAQRREENGDVYYSFNIHMQGENETVFFDA